MIGQDRQRNCIAGTVRGYWGGETEQKRMNKIKKKRTQLQGNTQRDVRSILRPSYTEGKEILEEKRKGGSSSGR